ncbi:hypothetical protein H8E88_21775 [candidate division KSB1 bacterium]|nr:hypothetical protein [candidate division KSB1 bacterium]MBL7092836.1 hypothetical protein [candidate division KSB1 bacterium]
MNAKYFNKWIFQSLIFFIFLISDLSGQIRSHEVGRLWDTRWETGSMRGSGIAPIRDQMTYPGADFFYQTRKNLTGRGLWIGVKDWTDKFGTFHTFYVSEGGPLNNDATEYCTAISNKKYFRERLPLVYVNGVKEVRPLDWRSGSGIYRKTSLSANEKITTIWTTNVGITVTRNSYAFANLDHDSYHILEHIFENTGNVDDNKNTKELVGQNLFGVYFGFIFSFIPSSDLGHERNGGERDDWVHYYGNQPGDTLRGLWYCYDGDSQRKDGDDIGDPSDINGEFLSPQYVGAGVLHADTGYDNEADDRSQPATVNYWSDRTVRSHTKGDAEQTLYSELSSGIQSQGTDEGQYSYPWESEVQGPMVYVAFGPYDIPYNEDVRIVIYNSVGMISRKLAINYGQRWKNGELTYNNLTGDEAKNDIIATGRDSLFMYASRAEWTWENGLEAVPDGPLTPGNFNINSAPGKIELQWDAVDDKEGPDTGEFDFAGYRMYRTESFYTNEYYKIWECGGSSGIDVSNIYIDRNVERGKNYYYYVTAYDIYGIESSHFYNRNYQTAAIPVLAARTDLDSVFVVPNPFHVQGHVFGGTFEEDYLEVPRKEDQIMFVGLPARAIIRIFTVHGDLVVTLHHPNPDNPLSIPESSDEAFFQITDSWETMKSGVYFFHVEGWDLQDKFLGTTTGKFIVIR